MQKLRIHLAIIFTLSLINLTSAGSHLSVRDLLVYPDRDRLSFDQLLKLQSKDSIQFSPYQELLIDVPIYWVRVEASALKGADYLYLSHYFEVIEAYYPGDTTPHSRSGRFIDFEDRHYTKGFYLQVIDLKNTGEPLYLRLISDNGYSRANRSIEEIEIGTAEDLESQSDLISTSFTLATGMSIIILLVNLVLFYLRPSFTVGLYALVILTGMLISNYQNQIFVHQMGFSAIAIHYQEMWLGIFIVYCFKAFAAFYLKAYDHSKVAYWLLILPLFPFVGATYYFADGLFFVPTAIFHFLLSILLIIYCIVKAWKDNRARAKIFIWANAFSVAASLILILALNDFLPQYFLTTSTAYLGYIIRDAIFSIDLVKNYLLQLHKDSNERKAAIQRLTEEKEQLKYVEQLKTTFFNNISHELRTPLTLVLSPLESSLKSGKIPDELKKELNLSLKNGKYLLQLVNELLDLAKLDNGKLLLLKRPTEVIPVIKKIIENFKSYASQNDQTLYITYSSESITADLDQDKFEKIMINLISNAIKYSDGPGQVDIKVEIKHVDMVISVNDEGKGISPEDQQFIFDRFFQSEENVNSGTGIGLSIVQEFTELHGGTVSFFSQPGVGSTFTLTFPGAVNFSPQPTSVRIMEHDSSKHTVLIIEDHIDMRSYLRDQLSIYNIAEAGNGIQAIQLLESGLQPDLILTDYVMPEMDGYEFAKQVKENEIWATIPIIFLTARTLDPDKIKVLSIGVDDYIIKPFNPEELKVRVNHLIRFYDERKKLIDSAQEDSTIEREKTFKHELEEYIHANLNNSQLSNSTLAVHFNLSERNLYRKVKEHTGQAPASFIREVRLQKARYLIESGVDLTISEVARKCGINHLAHFSQAFKKRFGRAPSEITDSLKLDS